MRAPAAEPQPPPQPLMAEGGSAPAAHRFAGLLDGWPSSERGLARAWRRCAAPGNRKTKLHGNNGGASGSHDNGNNNNNNNNKIMSREKRILRSSLSLLWLFASTKARYAKGRSDEG